MHFIREKSIIAILQNNASSPISQSVKYCVRNLSHSAKLSCLHYFIELL